LEIIGIVKEIDALGRLHIPKDIRNRLEAPRARGACSNEGRVIDKKHRILFDQEKSG